MFHLENVHHHHHHLHGLGPLTCSGIDALSSFPGASTISSSSRFLRAYFGSLVLSILSRWLTQFCLCLNLTSSIPEISSFFLMTSYFSSLLYPLTLPRKRISAASRRVLSRFVVTHVSLPWSSVDLATTINFISVSVWVLFKFFLIVPHIPWNLFIFVKICFTV